VRVLHFYAKDEYSIPLEGEALPAGRSLNGFATAEGVCVGFHEHRVSVEEPDPLRDPQPPAARVLIDACRVGEAWAADELTAKLCGVVFVPLQYDVAMNEAQTELLDARWSPTP
jgi:hypothetical protein